MNKKYLKKSTPEIMAMSDNNFSTNILQIYIFPIIIIIFFFGLFRQDEVLAISDKVVIRANDLMTWMDRGSNWTCGLQASANRTDSVDAKNIASLKITHLDFGDINQEKGSYLFVCIKIILY